MGGALGTAKLRRAQGGWRTQTKIALSSHKLHFKHDRHQYVPFLRRKMRGLLPSDYLLGTEEILDLRRPKVQLVCVAGVLERG